MAVEDTTVRTSFVFSTVPGSPPAVDVKEGTTLFTCCLYQNTLTWVALWYCPSRNLGLSYASSAASLDGNSINAFPPPFRCTAIAENLSLQDLTNSTVLHPWGRSSMTSECSGSGCVTLSVEDQ